jgi:hypothetical protein
MGKENKLFFKNNSTLLLLFVSVECSRFYLSHIHLHSGHNITSPRLTFDGTVGIRRRLPGDLGGKSRFGSFGIRVCPLPVIAGRITSLRLFSCRS